MTSNETLSTLPDYFGHAKAVATLGARRFQRDISNGAIVRLQRGLYRKSDASGDDDLAVFAMLSQSATICLASALAHHDLTDEIPASINIAIPRGDWAPKTPMPVAWHRFDRSRFNVGRTKLPVADGLTIGLYDAERSIVDAYRLAHREGTSQANEALRRWLRRGGQPSLLLRTATRFPKALPGIRAALEVLL